MSDYLATYLAGITSTELAEVRAAMARVSPEQVLAHSGVQAVLTGTLTETALATIPMAAGLMGVNDCLRITSLWTYTNSANVKTLRVRMGGLAGTAFTSQVPTTTETLQCITMISNRNSVSSQVGANSANLGVASSGSPVVTGSVDTSLAQDIVLSGQLANVGELIRLERYLVELVRG